MNIEEQKLSNDLSISNDTKTFKKVKHLNPELRLSGLNNINENQEIHYLIYRMDNTINGKYYIGQHETTDIMDGYEGSGKYLNRAEQKYGLSAFVKTFLYDFNSFEEMNNKEKELVQLSNCFPYDPMSYNLREGGSNGRLSEYSIQIGKEHFKETWQNRSKEEKERYSKECSKRLTGEGNPMYGKDWREGKTKEELKLHGQKISNSHKKRTPEQKQKDKEKELLTKANRPQYLKDIHHQKCSKHAHDNWNDPIIKQKMLNAMNNKTQEQKDKENAKRSKSVNEFWDQHPERREVVSKRVSGKGNGMYGRRKMRLISDPSIKVLVKQEDIQKYLNMGYEFSQNYNKLQYEIQKVNNNCNEKCN